MSYSDREMQACKEPTQKKLRKAHGPGARRRVEFPQNFSEATSAIIVRVVNIYERYEVSSAQP